MTLKIANEIEETLNNEGLVGKRMGSGFCFLDNSRDVMFEYSSNEVKEYLSKIEKLSANLQQNTRIMMYQSALEKIVFLFILNH